MAAEDVALLGQERRAGPPLAAEPCENCNVVGVWLVALQQSYLHQSGHWEEKIASGASSGAARVVSRSLPPGMICPACRRQGQNCCLVELPGC